MPGCCFSVNGYERCYVTYFKIKCEMEGFTCDRRGGSGAENEDEAD